MRIENKKSWNRGIPAFFILSAARFIRQESLPPEPVRESRLQERVLLREQVL